MKAITKILIPLILLLAIVWGCESEQIIGETIYDGPSFLRFYLITNSNDEPIGEDELEIGKEPTEELVYQSLKPLKIPVSLTYPKLNKDVHVKFSTNINGDYNQFTITPTEELNFNSSNLLDTITISFHERWNTSINHSIEFELTECDDNTVSLGQLNDYIKNKTLSVTLGKVVTTSSFSTNRVEINGEAGEQIEFEVLFNNGFLPQEIEALDLFSEIKGFEYTLERIIEDDNNESIKYIMTITNDIQNDEVTYTTTLALNDGTVYEPTGNTILQIVKPLNIARDKAVFTSANFYDLSNPYYKTYGENWFWSSSDNICKWKAFNAYTFPVVVEKDDDNAILYSDNGTEDESDDIYHHAFRIGFRDINDNRTTNSFSLKNWFNNESTSPELSPGLNIPEALEFYPKDGVSETEGAVLVIPQIITISNREGISHNISISGEGTYQEISPGLFEISLEFKATNEELFDGTRVSYYKIYNSRSYGGDPDPIDNGCIEPIDL
ncbi:hypothetical protein [Plebeiibacterium sediminum]|uniref:Uncharacterized protein n=1 Tax=Plebeiibacterium sediminum TaxID=2992112 RepID=A0AAE3M477_9BACT|nr:hypothetical protein [Plebeiobacterium sediminum]MCW3786564.1 hypothetical protein [Plebeiobacterium sediminum]